MNSKEILEAANRVFEKWAAMSDEELHAFLNEGERGDLEELYDGAEEMDVDFFELPFVTVPYNIPFSTVVTSCTKVNRTEARYSCEEGECLKLAA